MKSRPILFSAPMVLALLAGTKTQTRRLVKPQPPHSCSYVINGRQSHALCYATATGCTTSAAVWVPPTAKSTDHRLACPHGAPGDRLWVQESYQVVGHGSVGPSLAVRYLADGVIITKDVSPETYAKFRSRKTTTALGGRFMYRDISRINLELTSVRVERLQDISASDAIDEGIEQIEHCGAWFYKNYRFKTAHPRRGETVTDEEHRTVGYKYPRDSYRSLWESINGAGSWAANPWVWCETFRRITP